MIKTTAFIAIMALTISTTAFAQTRGPLGKALSTAEVRRVLTQAPATAAPAARSAQKKGGHPVLIGLLVGGVAGAFVGNRQLQNSIDNCPAGRSCSTAGAGALLIVLAGAGIGALVGSLFRR